MTKASEEKLGELHGVVAEALTTVIREGVVVSVPESGDPVKTAAPASYFAAAIALLKNNNITADPTKNAALTGLAAELARKRQERKGGIQGLKEATELFERQVGDMTDAT